MLQVVHTLPPTRQFPLFAYYEVETADRGEIDTSPQHPRTASAIAKVRRVFMAPPVWDRGFRNPAIAT